MATWLGHADLKPSPYVWLLTFISAAGKLFQCPGRSRASGVPLLSGKALLSRQVCGSPSITSLRRLGISPSEGCSWEVKGDFSSETRMPLQSGSTGPAQEVPRPSRGMKGTPTFAACAGILHNSEKSWVVPLACVSAEEANHVFLKLYFSRALCCTGRVEKRRGRRSA